jgi:hypothetical protein
MIRIMLRVLYLRHRISRQGEMYSPKNSTQTKKNFRLFLLLFHLPQPITKLTIGNLTIEYKKNETSIDDSSPCILFVSLQFPILLMRNNKQTSQQSKQHQQHQLQTRHSSKEKIWANSTHRIMYLCELTPE